MNYKSMGILIVLMIVSGIVSSVLAGTDAEPSHSIDVDKPVHFLSTKGEDIVVAPGTYLLESDDHGLKMTNETDGQSLLLHADSGTHDRVITEPKALSMSLEMDQHVFGLLLPDGKSLESVGSYSGVHPRGFGDFLKRAMREHEKKRRADEQLKKKYRDLVLGKTRMSKAVSNEPEHMEFEPDCIKLKPKKLKKNHKKCKNPTGKGRGLCAKYLPAMSDTCTASSNRKLPIHFDYFGDVDCRALKKKPKHKFTTIVIHNGGSAERNTKTWWCKKAVSHYTIDRDGKVYQHLGEEFRGRHVVGHNNYTIGIELETNLKWRTESIRCNKMPRDKLKTLAKKYKIKKGQIVKDLCAPTAKQYVSLKRLVADIKSRHPIIKGDRGVVGHCELLKKGGKSQHSDPRAFDWSQLGMSNKDKLNYVKKNKRVCSYYDLY